MPYASNDRQREKFLAEIERLRAVIKVQGEYADGCMEGAGEPEFSQFSIIAASCRKALAAQSE